MEWVAKLEEVEERLGGREAGITGLSVGQSGGQGEVRVKDFL